MRRPDPGVPRPYSLRWRLLLAAAAWIALALLLVGVLLVGLFRHHAEQELAARAAGPLDALAAALTVELPAPVRTDAAAGPAAAPLLTLARDPAAADFQADFRRPYGGAYWWVAEVGADAVPAAPGNGTGARTDPAAGTEAGPPSLLRSRSWWDAQPDAALAASLARQAGPEVQRFEASGPQQQPLVVWARRLELAGWERPLVVAVALDATRLRGVTRDFARTVAAALAALALALWAASGLQVRQGLAPLGRLQQALTRLRAGQPGALKESFPAEVQPLVDELNALLVDNQRLVHQAREQTANLAHALKTPLAVLGNAAADMPGEAGVAFRGQLALIHRQVELQLARARATAASALAGRSGERRAEAAPVVDGLLRTLQRLHAGRGIQAQLTGVPTAPAVALEPDVLHELLGNLLDNAFRWARSQVQVRLAVEPAVEPVADGAAAATAPCLRLAIDDDGPGIPPAQRQAALQRGRRLDETEPGSGLGLAIADELVRLAGGALQLQDSPLGGLRVSLQLPLAP
jgi:signal transduction histidine kinase